MEQKDIKQALQKLNQIQLLTFGYALCKRLFPNYAVFSEFSDFGKPEILYESLVGIRKQILGANNKTQIKSLAKMLWNDEELTPDMDDFPGSILASLALNTVSAFYYCLKYVKTNKTEEIEHVANASLESAIGYSIVKNEINQNLPKEKYYSILYNSDEVKSEMAFQQMLIRTLSKSEKINRMFLINLKIPQSVLGENALNFEAEIV